MYPVSDSESWLGIKPEPVEDPPSVGNVSRSWQWRERGIDPPSYPPNKKVFENIAEDILVQKPLQIRSCDLPGYPRSTFLMVFSPDGTKVASTHGNHNVYVSELASGKHVRILKGHPRTPWCIAFHPSHTQLIGSGCLGGQVRVWDIASGGSEVWNVRNETVIASIAFHPREQLLVIATFNELYFWDWSHPAPFTKVSTNNINEKVRFVAFDSLGYKLITGISLWATNANANNNPLSTSSSNSNGPSLNGGGTGGGGRGDTDDTPGSSRPPENPGAAQDMIVNSYQTLVQRYDSLVRNYQRLFMVRHRLTNTPSPPNTIDRGTDPMEAYPIQFNRRRRLRRSNAERIAPREPDEEDSTPSTSQDGGGDSGDGDISTSRFLNFDVLSINSDASRTNESTSQDRSPFGSILSAFQPLNEAGRSFLTVDQNERTRLLPNPFSSRSNNPQQRQSTSVPRSRRFTLERSPASTDLHSSRTSIFTSSRPNTLARDLILRRRNARANQSTSRHATNNTTPSAADPMPSTSSDPSPGPTTTNSSTQMSPDADNIFTSSRPHSLARDLILRRRNARANQSTSRHATNSTTPSAADPIPSTSSDPSPGPTTTNSSTQMSPDADNVDAQTINESLDLIRDILRDSGTRLLNLITNMSMNLMADRPEDGNGEGARRPRMQLFTGNLRRDFLASSSDSDGDHTDILRTPNEAFREPDASRIPEAVLIAPGPAPSFTDRMFLELSDASLSSGGFRVRSQTRSTAEDPPASEQTPPAPTSTPTAEEPQTRTEPNFDPNVPSTSRDNFSPRVGPRHHAPGVMPSAEAYRRVRYGVTALQKHTTQLSYAWLRGDRMSMKELRIMWENLRRQILALQGESGRQEVPPRYYTRSLLERCMILTEMTRQSEMTEIASRHSFRRRPRSTRNVESQRNARENTANSDNPSTSNAASSSSTESIPHSRPTILRSPRMWGSRGPAIFRRRFQFLYNRYNQARNTERQARPHIARAIEMGTTRHEIRMRAMQVLSVMFNLMMICLGERGLSHVITHMLKALKKALALSCFMMMSNRSNLNRSSMTTTTPSQNVESMDVVRIQNVEHTGPVNVDGPDDPASPRVNPPNEERTESSSQEVTSVSESPNTGGPSTSHASVAKPTTEPSTQSNVAPSVNLNPDDHRWSHRVAVQIAAANRNNSSTARTRRELYIEFKRQKALHRCNPAAHPYIRRRFPPVNNHRIPALRSLPSRIRNPILRPMRNEAPVDGPAAAPQESSNQAAPRVEMNEMDDRINLIRIAHMQAVRLRNTARNRFRRLQTIRLYTPSSVFALQSNSNENAQENRPSSAQNEGESNRRQHYGSQGIFPPHEDERGNFFAAFNNIGMQVNESPPSTAQGHQAHRLPRIHEYLQPIILAQNAMVVEDEGDGGGGGGGNAGGIGRRMGGMAGILDASIISEALPAPSNRVQAWDFTTGRTPEISDSTKNVVVQRCRIHNDASIDISKDGRLLVALLPSGIRLRNTNSWLGVYSLEWARLGQCLHTAMLEQSAVSVALSPTARYLAVGLGSRRFTSAPHSRTNIIALLYKLDPIENSSRNVLSPIKELMQHWEHGFTSLNCLRWAPQPGQGLVYANNTGQLIIMS